MVSAVVPIEAETDKRRGCGDRVRNLEGIVKTDTMIAFKVYFREDIEGIFSVGGE